MYTYKYLTLLYTLSSSGRHILEPSGGRQRQLQKTQTNGIHSNYTVSFRSRFAFYFFSCCFVLVTLYLFVVCLLHTLVQNGWVEAHHTLSAHTQCAQTATLRALLNESLKKRQPYVPLDDTHHDDDDDNAKWSSEGLRAREMNSRPLSDAKGMQMFFFFWLA